MYIVYILLYVYIHTYTCIRNTYVESCTLYYDVTESAKWFSTYPIMT